MPLYVVATPIGNLEDLTPRAAEVLRTVDLVAAEDTRRTRVLLEHVGATTRMLSFHAHSPRDRVDKLLDVLREGKSVALVTDAGTPVVSDPGAALVRCAHDAQETVIPIAGASAVAVALSASGLPADRYTFVGFVPKKGKLRRAVLERIGRSEWTAVAFESPARLPALLGDLIDVCGAERRAVVCRELTKMYEEIRPGTLSDLAVYYQNRPPKGEITLVVAGDLSEVSVDLEAARTEARALLDQGASRRDVAARLHEQYGVTRNAAYRLVTEL